MADVPWAELAARLLLPIVVWLSCAGVSLFAERLLRIRLPDALLVPAGLGPAMTLALVGHELDVPPWLWTGVLVAVAVAGLVLARRELRRVVPLWVVGTAGATYLLFVSPVLFAAAPTWAGYNFLNDTSVQFLLSSWIQDGAPASAFPAYTPGAALHGYVATSYPLGTHAHLATFDLLLGLRPEVTYQAYLAVLAAIGAVALLHLLRVARAPWLFAAAAAVVAVGANLTFQYALQGSIKEIGFVAAFLATAALSRELVVARRPAGVAVLWGLAAAGGLAAYSAAGLPYLAILGALTLPLVLLRRDLPLRGVRLPAIGAGALTLAVAGLPSAKSIIDFAHVITGIYTDSAGGPVSPPLGQLQAPLPAYQGLGVWLHGDYVFRVPPGLGHTVTVLAAGAIAALAVAGVVLAARRREPAALLAALPAAGAFAIVAPRVTPYADAKMLALGGPAVVALAAWALVPVLRGRFWALGTAVAGLLALTVIASDAMALHDVRLAPRGRMDDLRDIGKRYAGRGPILASEFEEFAKYFARDTELNAATESVAAQFVALRRPEAFLGYSYDLDDQVTSYVTSFPYILLRRGPAASRPPASYRLDYRNASYEMWRRASGPKILEHLPLGDPQQSSAVPSCPDVRRLARKAPDGAALVAAQAPEQAVLDLVRKGVPAANAHVSPGWGLDPLARDALSPATPGRAWGDVGVAGGRYGVWVRGSFPRPMHVYVNGRHVGDVQGVDTPNGWLRAATIALPRGRARVEVRRSGGRALPGDGAHTSIGAVSLAAQQPERLIRVAARDAQRLCGKPWDWIEVVRP